MTGLQAQHVSVALGSTQALRDVSFAVAPG